jgi:hypothetical protein
MLAAPALIDRSMTSYWAGVSGNGNNYSKMDIFHHGLRQISIICHLRDPSCFSLVTTFNPRGIGVKSIHFPFECLEIKLLTEF